MGRQNILSRFWLVKYLGPFAIRKLHHLEIFAIRDHEYQRVFLSCVPAIILMTSFAKGFKDSFVSLLTVDLWVAVCDQSFLVEDQTHELLLVAGKNVLEIERLGQYKLIDSLLDCSEILGFGCRQQNFWGEWETKNVEFL
jgi:hypothetical protein